MADAHRRRPTLPSGDPDRLRHPLRRHPAPDGGWSAWQPVGRRRRHRQPGRALHPVPRPDGQHHRRRRRRRSNRVQISFGAGADRAPVPGTVTVAPASPETNQTLTATPSGFSDPDGDPLTYHYRWLRNGTRDPRRHLGDARPVAAGNGDRGDEVRAEVYATDGRGAASDPVFRRRDRGQHRPDGRQRGGQARRAGHQRRAQGGAERLRRHRRRPAHLPLPVAPQRHARSAAPPPPRSTSRWPGNGDLNDRIDVDVTAVDGDGGTSPAARGGQNVTGTNATPVEGTRRARAGSPEDQPDRSRPRPSGFSDPDGDALTYRYRWLRNGTAIAGATAATLDLSLAGNGDRGDAIRVEVSAADPGGRASDPAVATVTVANTAPTAGTRDRQAELAVERRHRVRPCPAGSPTPTATRSATTYQWFRNGTAISGATGRTLDLAEPGNGDAGDTRRGGRDGARRERRHERGRARQPDRSAAAPRTPWRPSASRRPPARRSLDESGGNDGTLGRRHAQQRRPLRPRALVRRRGRHGDGARRRRRSTSPSGLTLEAWVRPQAATDWRSVIFKESARRRRLRASTPAATPTSRA